MASQINNNYYQKKENKYKYINSNKDKNNNIYKTKTDILPYNLKYKQEPKIYIKLDPEYLENNYKNAEKKYLKNQNDLYSPTKDNNRYNNNNYLNNTVDNNNRRINSFNNNNKENKTISPIKKYIEKKNFNFYLNKGIKAQNQNDNNKNDINNVKEENYANKSVDLNYSKNNRYIDNNNIDTDSIRSSQTQRKYLDSFNINIYQKKMIIIFTQIINRIMQRNKRKNILKIFLNNIKKYYTDNKEENDNYNKKFQKKNTKYNEYKNIIDNYVKTNNNNDSSNKNNELINKMKNRKEPINQRNNNNNLKLQKTENDIRRLKELQKKYAQIYKKKKNESNISNDYKYRNYILRKTKTQNIFNNNKLYKSTQNNYLNDISQILSEKKKAKLLKSKLIRNIKDSPHKSFRKKYNPYMNNQKSQAFYTMPNLEESEETPTKSNNINNNKIIVKKLKITPRLSKNIKKENIIKKNEEIYKIYNIKDIVTMDKRLYVYINYITLYNKKKEDENSMNYYDNNLLKISNEININIYGLNKNKSRLNRYLLKIPKNLCKIEEESYSRGNENMKINNDIEKGILKLEKYKNNLKNEIIKKSIINYKK